MFVYSFLVLCARDFVCFFYSGQDEEEEEEEDREWCSIKEHLRELNDEVFPNKRKSLDAYSTAALSPLLIRNNSRLDSTRLCCCSCCGSFFLF